MNFSDYKAIILRNKYVRVTIIYDLICCFMLLAALFIFDTRRGFLSVMFAYAVPLMCAAIFGMYIVSMSSNRKICLLFPSLTYHLSLLIYALLANNIPALFLSLASFVPFLMFAIHIFTGSFQKLCTVFISVFITILTIIGIASALLFSFSLYHSANGLANDVYNLLGNNLGVVEVCIFTNCSLVPFLASCVSAMKAVEFEEKKANGDDDRPPDSILI